MQTPIVQEWFFREIQRAFREGVPPDVLFSILAKYLLIGGAIVAGFALWRYREWLLFHVRRLWNSRRYADDRQRIAAHLIGRKFVVGIYFYTRHSRQYLGTGVITGFKGSNLTVYLTSEVAGSMRRTLIGRRVQFFFRPFRAGGKRINSFVSYIRGVRMGDGRIRSLQAFVPDHFAAVPRRKHVRLRIRQNGGVRVKLWCENKKKQFWVTAPDYETPETSTTTPSWKATAIPLDISPGGIKVQIRPQRTSPILRISEEVVLELLILDRANKTFHTFLLLGVVRNVMRPGGGVVMLGIQFRALGERVASRSVDWKLVGNEVPPLQKILERLRAKPKCPDT
ncbi:hypothetical protein SAMN02745704_02652 [Paucidesulfovibrio gracilis DSM 16080]|uniref:PilZ domain-containing protein n=1 Tax=Paucidesulfovibrio gracilis DSM 16080 TaxID=1121449 RepID=A0A1T4Y1S5_9BACT|nr:hypothetical protein [Paucidesulfovibrio gracilis]SKA95235.1 hypothetical protein SAMN02745704_02652 [Paucidesulfovibrio gracilis DSM 16080]